MHARFWRSLPHSTFSAFRLGTGGATFLIVIIITCYIPFEDLAIGLLPLPRLLRSLCKFVPEFVLYINLAGIVYRKVSSGEGLQKTPIDMCVVAFFVSAIFSIVTNSASIPGSIDNLRTNWRYLVLYYSFVNVDLGVGRVRQLLDIIKFVSILEACIASILFFLPPTVKVAFAGGNCDKAFSKRASCGTFADSANLAALVLVALVVILVDALSSPGGIMFKLSEITKVGISYFAMFASKKRAAFMFSLLLPFLALFLLRKWKNLSVSVWVVFAAVTMYSLVTGWDVVTSNSYSGEHLSGGTPEVLNYFTEIFTREYWERTSENSRGWAILVTLRALVQTGKWWFGFGPELGSVRDGIIATLDPEDQAQLIRNLGVYDDSFWFALLGYFGVTGLALYWWTFYHLFRASKSMIRNATTRDEKLVGTILNSLLVCGFLYSFVERLPRLREYSFYLWLFAGIAMNFYCRQRELAQVALMDGTRGVE